MTGNASSLLNLLVRDRVRVLGWIRRIVHSETAAEDVVQNLWFRIDRIDDHPPILNHQSFLFRLAKNVAVDYVRAEASRASTNERAQAHLWAALDGPGLEQEAIDRETLARIIAAAEALPEPTRTILRLSRFEGLKQREIAEQMGLSTTTVENHLRRAMARLNDVRDED